MRSSFRSQQRNLIISKYRWTPKETSGIATLVEDSTPSSCNKDDVIQVEEIVEAENQDSDVKATAQFSSSSLEKLMSQLSSEMIKTTTQQKMEVIEQIHKEKQELKLEWEKLQKKIKVGIPLFRLNAPFAMN